MKTLYPATTLGFSSFSAFANDNVYTRYEKLAQALADAAGHDVSIADLRATNSKLITTGIEIMKMYGKKFSECAAQYQDFESKIPTLPNLSVAEIHRLYHNGEGLPQAPRTCYLGRSLVVHPAMSDVRLADGVMTAEEKEEVIDESFEVVEHVRTVEQRIASN